MLGPLAGERNVGEPYLAVLKAWWGNQSSAGQRMELKAEVGNHSMGKDPENMEDNP